jgi:hypothetical protein
MSVSVKVDVNKFLEVYLLDRTFVYERPIYTKNVWSGEVGGGQIILYIFGAFYKFSIILNRVEVQPRWSY